MSTKHKILLKTHGLAKRVWLRETSIPTYIHSHAHVKGTCPSPTQSLTWVARDCISVMTTAVFLKVAPSPLKLSLQVELSKAGCFGQTPM